MTGRSDEVQTGMNSEINFINATRLLLLKHVRLMLVVQKLDNWHPRIAVVHIIPKSRRVNDRKANY